MTRLQIRHVAQIRIQLLQPMISPDLNRTPMYPVTFREFQNRARLYVIGALDPEELPLFDEAAKAFGPKAQRFIRDCNDLRDAFALSLRPAKVTMAIRDRLSSMVRQQRSAQLPQRQGRSHLKFADSGRQIFACTHSQWACTLRTCNLTGS